jgi:hypothetical protein
LYRAAFVSVQLMCLGSGRVFNASSCNIADLPDLPWSPSVTPFAPFPDCASFELARNLYTSGLSITKTNHLLDTISLQTPAGLSGFSSHREMLGLIESIPALRVRWKQGTVFLSCAPPDVTAAEASRWQWYKPQEVVYRDIIELIRSLFSDMAYQGHMAFDPVHDYRETSPGQFERTISEIHTANMWWNEQV